MTYPGLRESRHYLHKVEDVRRSASPHHLVSVIGGGAFIHAISQRTLSVLLVDNDPDGCNHATWLLTAISACPQLIDFKAHLRRRYEDDPNVELEGHGLQPGKYYWHFGEGAFTSPVHYQRLRDALKVIEVTTLLQDIGKVDYSRFDNGVVVLGSNVESRIYGGAGRVVSPVLATCRVPARVITWMFDIRVEPNVAGGSYEAYSDV